MTPDQALKLEYSTWPLSVAEHAVIRDCLADLSLAPARHGAERLCDCRTCPGCSSCDCHLAELPY